MEISNAARMRAACSGPEELTRFPDFGKTENYGRRGSCSSRAKRRRPRLPREGETKSQYVTAIESNSAATPSSNCQPVPTRTFFLKFRRFECRRHFCHQRTAMLLAKPEAGKRRDQAPASARA